MIHDPERVPVIVGVGQVNDRPDAAHEGLGPIALMAEALRRADGDAGGGLLAECDHLAVVRQIAFPLENDAAALLADTLGIAPAFAQQSAMPNGDTPTRLLNEAANAIGAGEARICAVVGAEALRTAGAIASRRQLADAASGQAGNPSTAERKPDPVRDSAHRRREGYAPSYGLIAPTDVYPLLENALRARLGQTLAEAQLESGVMWAGLSQVAANNENAWLRSAIPPEEVITPSPANRPIAFPYTKLQVANSAVNQGAGFLVTSVAEARRCGIDEAQMVHIGYGAAAAEAYDVLVRERYDRSPSMEASLKGTLEANAITIDEIAHVELYSCFPCIPKMARRILGWPLDRPISVVGGLTFGGGPIGNYMSHAIAQMTVRLRGTEDKGLLFGNGGAYATHNHSILLSGTPTDAAFPHDFDRQSEADALRGAIPPLAEGYIGPARIETFTVFAGRDGKPRAGVIVAATPDGSRTLAGVAGDDAQTIGFLTDGSSEPVGSLGEIVRGADGLTRWQR